MKTNHAGFTLIEMVAVIIILAIMAATALPRFVDLGSEARASSIQGLAGGLRSAAALARSKWLAQVAPYSTVVVMGTNNVTVWDGIQNATSDLGGYPRGDSTVGIVLALDNTEGYTSGIDTGTYHGYTFWPSGAGTSTTCYARYESGTVTVVASASGCL